MQNGSNKLAKVATLLLPVFVGVGVALGRYVSTGDFDAFAVFFAVTVGYFVLALAALPVVLHRRSVSASKRRED